MRCLLCGLFAAVALSLLPTTANAADGVTVVAESPRLPTALQSAVIGLSLTAVVAVAARVTHRSSDTMMYMVLASLAITGVLVAASDRAHGQFNDAARQVLQAAAR